MRRVSSVVLASILISQAIPVQAMPIAPQFKPTTVQKFDRIESDGGFIVRDVNALKALGYDPSRTWRVGDSVGDAIQLSDLNQISPVEDLTYNQIFKSSNLSANQVRLGDAPLLKRQTIGDWAAANPHKVGAAIKGVPAFQSLVSGNWKGSVTSGWAIAAKHSQEFQKILKDHPELADLPVSSIINADWKGTLPFAQKVALKEIDRHLPEKLKGVPGKSLGVLTDLRKGRLDRAAAGAISIADALRKAPDLKNLPLGALGDDVPISSIPGLSDTPIGKLSGWKGSKVSDNPGLKDSPLNYVSISNILGILNGDIFANLDVPRGGAEQLAANPISGGTRGGTLTPEPCDATQTKDKKKKKVKDCANLELQDTGIGILDTNKNSIGGSQWVSGKSQKVKGGKGFLKSINGGWEPTGIQPWPAKSQLKLVLMDVAETDGKTKRSPSGIAISEKAGYGTFAMYAQFCIKKLFVNLGCSPHFIGPIPFLLHPKVRQNGKVLLISSSGAPPIPDEWKRRIKQYKNQYRGNCAPGDGPPNPADGEDKYGYRSIAEADPANLVKIGEYYGYDQFLHKEAAASWEVLKSAAARDGVQLGAASAFRSKKLQAELFDKQTEKLGSPEQAATLSSPSGHSEHHSGYALDVRDLDAPGTDIKHSFGETEGYKWLKANAGKYGWAQSYDGNHDGPTTTEEWHWAYTKTDTAKQALNLRNAQESRVGQDSDVRNDDGDQAISSVKRPQNEREEFLAKTVALAKKYGLPPEELLTVMSFETAGTLSPSKTNKQGYTGLIQFGYDTARDLGTSTAALRRMSRVEQLDWVDRYFEQRGLPKAATTEQLYATVLVGNPGGNIHAEDSNRTSVSKAIKYHFPAHRQKAISLLKEAKNLDTSGYTFSGGSGVDCVAGSGGGGNFVQGDGKSLGNLQSPIPGAPQTSPFGRRVPPCPGCSEFHKGQDLGVPIGTKIQAPDGGKVVYVGYESGYGKFMIIDHGNGLGSMYAHLSQPLAKEGDKVSKGQVFALSGNTGRGTGAHLHVEVYEGFDGNKPFSSGRAVDPRKYIRF